MYQSLLNPHKLDATAQRNEALGPTEAEWLSRLELTRSGRVLRNHLSCVEKRLDTHGRQGERGSIQDAICWRRAFCKALNDAVASKAAFPCGIPKNGWRYLAIVNLSGERLMLYSDSDCMMRMLCKRSSVLRATDIELHLAKFTMFADSARKACNGNLSNFVLIVYNMPWQSGMRSTYWEVSTVTIDNTPAASNKCVYDRNMVLTSESSSVVTSRPTLADNGEESPSLLSFNIGTIEIMPKKTISEFLRNLAASSVDVTTDSTNTTNAANKPNEEHAKVLALLSGMTEQRKAMLEEIKALKRSIKEFKGEVATLKEQNSAMKCIQEEQNCEESAASMIDKQLSTWESAVREIKAEKDVAMQDLDRIRASLADSEAALSDKEVQNRRTKQELLELREKVKRDEAAKNKLHNTTLRKSEQELKHLKEQMQREKKACEQQVHEIKEAMKRSATERDATETRLKERVREKERVIAQLGQNLEDKDLTLGEYKSAAQLQTKALNDLERKSKNSQAYIQELQASYAESAAKLESALETIDAQATSKINATHKCDASSCTSAETNDAGTHTHMHACTQTDRGLWMPGASAMAVGISTTPLPTKPIETAKPAKSTENTSKDFESISPSTLGPTGSTTDDHPAAGGIGSSSVDSPELSCMQAQTALQHLIEWTRCLSNTTAPATAYHTGWAPIRQMHPQHPQHPQHLQHPQPFQYTQPFQHTNHLQQFQNAQHFANHQNTHARFLRRP